MKTFAFVLIALGLCSLSHLHAADPWKEQPILSTLHLSAVTAIGEYEFWVEEWKKEKRKPTISDNSINLMAETTLLNAQMALEAHPNPQLLEQCLTFLGTIIPPEFDHVWRARKLEMAGVDEAITRKVDAKLKSQNLPSLVDQAMGRK